jgi:hypothetical protein
MDESWRRKPYYAPRVLIGVDDVLNTTYSDAILCLTAQELAMLRKITRYLHYRSTFAAEYHDSYYLCANNEEWDTLQAIVAQLEGKMATCEDFLEQLQCICESLRRVASAAKWPAGGTYEGQPDHDDYQSGVEENEGDPPEGFDTWDEWRVMKCKSAQKLIDDVVNALQRLQLTSAAGGTITFIALQTAILGLTITPPVAVALALVEILAITFTALAIEEVIDWVLLHKQSLVCAIYTAPTEEAAQAALENYIATYYDCVMSYPAVSYWLNHKVVSQAFDGTMPDYETWQANYSEAYCEACAEAYTFEFDPIAQPPFVLTDTNAEFTPEGWLHCWQGNGGGNTDGFASPGDGWYNLVVTVHYLGSVANPDMNIHMLEDDNQHGDWFGTVPNKYSANCNGSDVEWDTYVVPFTDPVELTKPWVAITLAGSPGDGTGFNADYLKVELTPTEAP